MTRHARTRRSALGLVLAALATVGLTSASATPREPLVYDALGDSYASGYVGPNHDCGRSRAAYAVQIDGRKRIALDNFVACAGATTSTLVSGGQLEALDAETGLVTLTIGGNDIGWSGAVGACLIGNDAQCATAIRQTRGRVTDVLPGRLDAVFAAVAARAPHAQVLVTGYPHLFSPRYGPFLAASPAEQQALNEGADLVDSVVAAAARRHGFAFVDVTKRFDDHGVDAPKPWITGPLDPAPFHPNVAGYRAYAAAVLAAIKPAAPEE